MTETRSWEQAVHQEKVLLPGAEERERRIASDRSYASSEPLVTARGLTKCYAKVPALRDVGFELHEREILGLVGPNGAGKTTLLRILATLTPPDSGTASIGGHVLSNIREIRRIIGFMPDFTGVYDDMTVREYFEFFSRAYDIAEKLRPYAIDEALHTIGLKDREEAVVEGLSRGMKQRLSLGRAILHKPRVLLLDEPASGLDPLARLELREILRGIAARGAAILISSHVLEDLADICSRIGVIKSGCLVCAQETDHLISEKGSHRMRIVARERKDELTKALEGFPGVEGLLWDGDTLCFHLAETSGSSITTLIRSLVEENLPLRAFYEEKPTLETAYLNVTKAHHPEEASL